MGGQTIPAPCRVAVPWPRLPGPDPAEPAAGPQETAA
jgi:hypothetical protein